MQSYFDAFYELACCGSQRIRFKKSPQKYLYLQILVGRYFPSNVFEISQIKLHTPSNQSNKAPRSRQMTKQVIKTFKYLLIESTERGMVELSELDYGRYCCTEK